MPQSDAYCIDNIEINRKVIKKIGKHVSHPRKKAKMLSVIPWTMYKATIIAAIIIKYNCIMHADL